MNLAQSIGRKPLDIEREKIEFQSDELYASCEALAPFLEKLVLVGGWALRALMELPNNDRQGIIPYTKDADFAIQLATRADFEEIERHLLEQGFNKRATLNYSFQKEHLIIEILPVGGESKTIVGFELPEYQLAFEDNHRLSVFNAKGNAVSLRVISISTLFAHKIFSYTDRNFERRKDLDHLKFLAERFGKEENKFGLTAKHKAHFEEETVVYELASAHLLGKELRVLRDKPILEEAKMKLKKIIQEIEEQDSDREEIFLQRLKILLDYMEDKFEIYPP